MTRKGGRIMKLDKERRKENKTGQGKEEGLWNMARKGRR
jgi:hypothetical protein